MSDKTSFRPMNLTANFKSTHYVEKKTSVGNHITKVIKEKWGQYFANNHFCTHLCSKKNGSLGIKLFSKAKSTKPSG